MSVAQTSCVCCHCKKKVTFHYERVNHKQQFLLSLFTLGLWLPMWLFSAFSKTRICDVCGEPVEE